MTEDELNPTNEMNAETTDERDPETMEAPASEATELEALRRQLAEKQQAYEDLEGQAKRLAADFDNFRRRQAQEKENLIKFAGERILERFVDVLDNFERALDAGRKATDPKDVVTGVEMIHRQLQDFLAKEGVTAMEPEGSPFDPNQHEAVFQQQVDDVPDQTVLEVFRRGYVLNGRVLRHAMVKVADNPAMPQAPTLEQESPGETEQTDSARSS